MTIFPKKSYKTEIALLTAAFPDKVCRYKTKQLRDCMTSDANDFVNVKSHARESFARRARLYVHPSDVT